MEMPYKREMLEKFPQATHFVQQISEGAAGNVSISRKCTSTEEREEVSGMIVNSLMGKSSQGETKHTEKANDGKSEKSEEAKKSVKPESVMYEDSNTETSTSSTDLQNLLFEEIKKLRAELDLTGKIKWGEASRKADCTLIGIEGAIEDKYCTLENASNIVQSELPKVLQPCNNSLFVTLYPISCVDPSVVVNVRELDQILLENLKLTLEKANLKTKMLCEVPDYEHLSLFPELIRQCESFVTTFKRCIESFKQKVSQSLPKLKDGTLSTEEMASIQNTLDEALLSMEEKIEIAAAYLTSKRKEDEKLKSTFQDLGSRGFENYFKKSVTAGSLFSKTNKIVLNFRVNEIEGVVHSQEKKLKGELNVAQTLDWFESTNTLNKLDSSLKKLSNMKNNRSAGQYQFGFGAIKETIRFDVPSETVKPAIGDIVMISREKNTLISEYKPKTPQKIKAECWPASWWHGAGAKITWQMSQKHLVPVSSIQIAWRPTNGSKQWKKETIWEEGFSYKEQAYRIYDLTSGVNYDLEMITKDILGIQSIPERGILISECAKTSNAE